MKTVIYARKSRGTEEELNNQVSICKDYCSKNSYEVSEVFSEIRSSQDFEREQYAALKKYVEENTNIRIIVTLPIVSEKSRAIVAVKVADLMWWKTL